MAKTKSETEPYLLEDVAPKNSKDIIAAAKQCRTAQTQKEKASEKVDVAKDKLLDLIKKADLKPIDGKIVVRAEGLLITVTPRGDTIKVKEEGSSNKPNRIDDAD